MAIRQSASAGGGALAIGGPRRRRPPRQQGPPTMGGGRWHAPSASPTPWDGTCDAGLTPSQVAVRDSHGGACELRHRTLSETGDASFPDGLCEGAALGAATSESAGGGARPTAPGATDVVPAAGRSRRLPAPSPRTTGCLSPTGPSPWGRRSAPRAPRPWPGRAGGAEPPRPGGWRGPSRCCAAPGTA